MSSGRTVSTTKKLRNGGMTCNARLVLWLAFCAVLHETASVPSPGTTHAEMSVYPQPGKSCISTEYHARFHQIHPDGTNVTTSNISGTHEIQQETDEDSWEAFATKCANLIKALVTALSNAVTSNPGDETKLQLDLKNRILHYNRREPEECELYGCDGHASHEAHQKPSASALYHPGHIPQSEENWVDNEEYKARRPYGPGLSAEDLYPDLYPQNDYIDDFRQGPTPDPTMNTPATRELLHRPTTPMSPMADSSLIADDVNSGEYGDTGYVTTPATTTNPVTRILPTDNWKQDKYQNQPDVLPKRTTVVDEGVAYDPYGHTVRPASAEEMNAAADLAPYSPFGRYGYPAPRPNYPRRRLPGTTNDSSEEVIESPSARLPNDMVSNESGAGQYGRLYPPGAGLRPYTPQRPYPEDGPYRMERPARPQQGHRSPSPLSPDTRYPTSHHPGGAPQRGHHYSPDVEKVPTVSRLLPVTEDRYTNYPSVPSRPSSLEDISPEDSALYAQGYPAGIYTQGYPGYPPSRHGPAIGSPQNGRVPYTSAEQISPHGVHGDPLKQGYPQLRPTESSEERLIMPGPQQQGYPPAVTQQQLRPGYAPGQTDSMTSANHPTGIRPHFTPDSGESSTEVASPEDVYSGYPGPGIISGSVTTAAPVIYTTSQYQSMYPSSPYPSQLPPVATQSPTSSSGVYPDDRLLLEGPQQGLSVQGSPTATSGFPDLYKPAYVPARNDSFIPDGQGSIYQHQLRPTYRPNSAETLASAASLEDESAPIVGPQGSPPVYYRTVQRPQFDPAASRAHVPSPQQKGPIYTLDTSSQSQTRPQQRPPFRSDLGEISSSEEYIPDRRYPSGVVEPQLRPDAYINPNMYNTEPDDERYTTVGASQDGSVYPSDLLPQRPGSIYPSKPQYRPDVGEYDSSGGQSSEYEPGYPLHGQYRPGSPSQPTKYVPGQQSGLPSQGQYRPGSSGPPAGVTITPQFVPGSGGGYNSDDDYTSSGGESMENIPGQPGNVPVGGQNQGSLSQGQFRPGTSSSGLPTGYQHGQGAQPQGQYRPNPGGLPVGFGPGEGSASREQFRPGSSELATNTHKPGDYNSSEECLPGQESGSLPQGQFGQASSGLPLAHGPGSSPRGQGSSGYPTGQQQGSLSQAQYRPGSSGVPSGIPSRPLSGSDVGVASDSDECLSGQEPESSPPGLFRPPSGAYPIGQQQGSLPQGQYRPGSSGVPSDIPSRPVSGSDVGVASDSDECLPGQEPESSPQGQFRPPSGSYSIGQQQASLSQGQYRPGSSGVPSGISSRPVYGTDVGVPSDSDECLPGQEPESSPQGQFRPPSGAYPIGQQQGSLPQGQYRPGSSGVPSDIPTRPVSGSDVGVASDSDECLPGQEPESSPQGQFRPSSGGYPIGQQQGLPPQGQVTSGSMVKPNGYIPQQAPGLPGGGQQQGLVAQGQVRHDLSSHSTGYIFRQSVGSSFGLQQGSLSQGLSRPISGGQGSYVPGRSDTTGGQESGSLPQGQFRPTPSGATGVPAGYEPGGGIVGRQQTGSWLRPGSDKLPVGYVPGQGNVPGQPQGSGPISGPISSSGVNEPNFKPNVSGGVQQGSLPQGQITPGQANVYASPGQQPDSQIISPPSARYPQKPNYPSVPGRPISLTPEDCESSDSSADLPNGGYPFIPQDYDCYPEKHQQPVISSEEGTRYPGVGKRPLDIPNRYPQRPVDISSEEVIHTVTPSHWNGSGGAKPSTDLAPVYATDDDADDYYDYSGEYTPTPHPSTQGVSSEEDDDAVSVPTPADGPRYGNTLQPPSILEPVPTYQEVGRDQPTRIDSPAIVIPIQDDEALRPVVTDSGEESDDSCCCDDCYYEDIVDHKSFCQTACKDLDEARSELKAILDKIKKKLKCTQRKWQAK